MKRALRALFILMVAISVGVWLWLRHLEHAYDQPYTLVEEGLYIGSSVHEPPPGTRAVVNLCGREDSYKTEASLWLPIFESGKEPDINWLRQSVEFIAAQRNAGRPTYVHCLAGMNRSGAVVTAFLMYEHGWTRDEALRFLQQKRDVVQPNTLLMRLLLEWESVLSEKRAASTT